MYKLYTTCPQSKDHPSDKYLRHALDVAQWSDDAGYTGMLIYSDNSIVDPWVVAQRIMLITKQLCPLVAVQPVYMHPYAVAKTVTSIALLYQRRVCLNMIAGGFLNDLKAFCDRTEHDHRYERLTEYSSIIRKLLLGKVVTEKGRFYQTQGLRLTPALPPEFLPDVLISGSSQAGRDAAFALDAVSVEYPGPPKETELVPSGAARGVRVGIIARDTTEEAWRIARERFPADRRGQLAHAMAVRVSDSVWQRRLAELAEDGTVEPDDPYWLWPVQNYSTFCPYFVGNYETVSREIARYLKMGYSHYILDIPRDPVDLETTGAVFANAAALAA